MPTHTNHNALVDHMLDALDDQGNPREPDMVVLPAKLTPAMAEEIRIDDLFTHKILQARYDALIAVAPEKTQAYRPMPTAFLEQQIANAQQDQKALADMMEIGQRLLEGHKRSEVDWDAFKQLETLLAELEQRNLTRQ